MLGLFSSITSLEILKYSRKRYLVESVGPARFLENSVFHKPIPHFFRILKEQLHSGTLQANVFTFCCFKLILKIFLT